MAEILGNMPGAWQRANLIQRVLLVVILLGCAAVMVVLVKWASKPSMALLYAGLEPEQAAKMVDKIRDEGTQYELRNGGTTILVPEEKVYALRLAMASQNLSTSQQGGYSILDRETFGDSPFKQQVNYKRALEGELVKSIQLMNGVVSARVHVVKPEGSIFAANRPKASATVVLQLASGKRLDSMNIAAISNLVAGAVEGLSSERVVIVDSAGTLLSGGMDNSAAKRAGTFMDYKMQIEDYYASKAEELLAAVLGPGRARVQVWVTVDRIGLTTETITYTKGVPEEEEIEEDTTTPVPGTGGEGGKPLEQKSKTRTTSKFRLPEERTKQTTFAGKITDMKVAALVDLSGQTTPEGDETTAAVAPLKLEDVKAIIQAALGLKDATAIEVKEAPIYQNPTQTAEQVEEAGMFSLDNILRIAKQASLGIFVMGALLMLKIFGGKKPAPAEAAEGTPVLEGQTSGAAGNYLPAGVDPNALRSRITTALQENPEEVKRLFLSWVEGEGGRV